MTSRPSLGPVELAQRLVRVDSSNPPGRERACVEVIAEQLRAGGIEPKILARDAGRPNLFARVPGRGVAPPLLLHGHIDAVPAGPVEQWRRDPFGGEIVDGELWGRGALDMKGGVAMLVTALLAAHQASEAPPGDVLLVVNADEEAGGTFGADWLVDTHPELFDGVRHALSEFGGYTQHVAGRRLYPIQVAQKRRCRLRVTVQAPSGHSASPHPGQVGRRLGEVLEAIDARRLPVHLTAPVSAMLKAMGSALPVTQQLGLAALRRPRLTALTLTAFGAQAEDLQPLLRNTVAVTAVRAGDAPNVVPGQAEIELDARLLPGREPDEVIGELQAILPDTARVELVDADRPAVRTAPDLSLMAMLDEALRELDPNGHPFPLVTPGFTDARHYDRLGIQTYGCLPMRLPPGLMPELLHAIDERVPAQALQAGARTLQRIVERYQPT